MKILIELEFLGTDKSELSDSAIKDSVYTYLMDLIQDDSLDYTIEGE